MGTAFIIMVIAMLMFYAVPVNKKYRSIFNKIIIGGIIVVALVLITTGVSFLKDYQLERFNFTCPSSSEKLLSDDSDTASINFKILFNSILISIPQAFYLYFLTINVALCPPNPSELDITTSTLQLIPLSLT